MIRKRGYASSLVQPLTGVAVFCLCLCLPAGSHGLTGAQVAIYNDTSLSNGGAWPEGINALKAMLDFYGYTHEDILPGQINQTTDLSLLYDVLIVPGGWAGAYNELIDAAGFDNIRRFVTAGGGFLGICAGAYFAADVVHWKPDFFTPPGEYDYFLDLFAGEAWGPALWIMPWTMPTGCADGILAGGTMTSIHIKRQLLPEIDHTLDMLYFGGPSLLPSLQTRKEDITVVAAYDPPPGTGYRYGPPAMIRFPFGEGRVFLSGPHPEVSFRDCKLEYDSKTWELLNRMLEYLLGWE